MRKNMPNSQKYFAGVEGGGTHSTLVISDGNGQLVGQAKGPGTNHWALGMQECARRILSMLNEAKQQAGISLHQSVDGLGLTLSGCEQESSNAELASKILDMDVNSAKSVFVGSDTAGSLATAAPYGGMVLIAGTGSNALLKTADGAQYGCGGWGHLLGDEGGAYWLAHRAVKTVFDHMDDMKPCRHSVDAVWEAVQEYFSAEHRADLLPYAYNNFDKSFFAGLTSKLAELATKGDKLSQSLFCDAGVALASHIAALIGKHRGDVLRVVCVGSVWKSWELMRTGLVHELEVRQVKTQLEFVRLRVSSAVGACWLAAQQVGYDLPRKDSENYQLFYTYTPAALNGNSNGNGYPKINGICENKTVSGKNGDECLKSNGFSDNSNVYS